MALVEEDKRFSTDNWDLVGTVPAQIGHVPVPVRGPLAPLATAVLQGRQVTVTAALSCVAEQIAQVVGTTGTYPDQRMQRFLFGACGSPVNHGGFASWWVDGVEALDDDKLVAQYQDDLRQMLEGAIPAQGQVGVAAVRVAAKFTVIVARTNMADTIEPFAPVPGPDGKVVVRGRVQKPYEVVRGMVNQGPFGVARCEKNPDVRLPQFEMSCPVTATDATAWMVVSGFEKGRMIGDGVVNLLLRPSGQAPTKYQRTDYVPSAPRAKDPDQFALQFVDALNVVRGKAGVGKVEAVSSQSDMAHRLSPHLMKALVDDDKERAEKVMMGFLAGWDIEAPVVNGSVDWVTTYGEDDIADLMATALAWPEGRFTLLNPEYDLLAVGETTAGERHFLLAGGWDRFDGHSIEADSKKAFTSLTTARRKFKRPPGVMPLVDKTAQSLAQKVDSGAMTAGDAIDELGKFAVSQYQNGMMMWAIYPRTLDDIAWPEELLDAPAVYISLAVAVERHEELAWSREVILLVAHFPQNQRYAGTPLPAGPIVVDQTRAGR